MEETHAAPRDGEAQPEARRIGGYEILEEIGHGGMGIIYRALDLSLNRVVALKVLREDLRSQPQLVSRFRREAQAAALLNHPNIVHIYAVGIVEDIPYIAMEYINGVPLSTIMQEEGPVHWEYALDIAEQVARALACAHAAHVIHRDIKPPNILIDSEGKAYVTDFGIAKILTAEEQLTVDGSRLGTPQYMSPERCKSGDVTAASDIYSLGVLLFQMITGRLPFEASSSVELVRKILSETPPRIRQYNSNVPENVERLVAYLIEKKPADRPSSAEKVCIAIALVRAGRPLEEAQMSLRSALDEFRRSDTPRPSLARADATTKLLPESPLARFTLHWFGTPHPWQVLVAAILVVLSGSLLGVAISAVSKEDPIVTAMRALDSDLTRWTPPPTLAQFSDETAGILTTKILLKDFVFRSCAWGRQTAYVELEGSVRSARAGQRMLCSVNPVARQAAVSFDPVPALQSFPLIPSLSLINVINVFADHPDDRAIVKFTSPDDGKVTFFAVPPVASPQTPAPSIPLLASGTDSRGVGIAPDTVLALDVGPDGSTLAVAVNSHLNRSCYLAEIAESSDKARQYHILTNQGAPITSVKYSDTGEKILYARARDDRLTEIWTVGSVAFESSSDGWSRDGVKVAEGRVGVSRKPFSPGGPAVVFFRRTPGDHSIVEVVAMDQEPRSIELGEGLMPAWHPSGAFVVAAAFDRSQHLQLFAIEVVPPYRRRQLTYLSNGIQPHCDISENGFWAMAPAADPDELILVFVDLSRVQF